MEEKDILKNFREACGLKQKHIAELSGLSQQTVVETEKGRTKGISKKILDGMKKVKVTKTMMAKMSDGTLEWVLKNLYVDTNTITVPYYQDINISAGAGGHNDGRLSYENIELPLDYPTFGYKNLEAVKIQGESMSPTFKNGSVIFLSRNVQSVIDGAPYVFRVGSEVFFKRLFKIPGKLIVKSDNPEFPEWSTTAEDIEIVGQVVAKFEACNGNGSGLASI